MTFFKNLVTLNERLARRFFCLFYDRFLVSFFPAQTSSNLTSSGKVSLYAELEAPPPSLRPSLSWPLVQKRRKRGPLGKISFPMFCHIVQLRRWLMIPTLKRIIMSDRKWFLVCVWHSTHHRSFFCSYLPNYSTSDSVFSLWKNWRKCGDNF